MGLQAQLQGGRLQGGLGMGEQFAEFVWSGVSAQHPSPFIWTMKISSLIHLSPKQSSRTKTFPSFLIALSSLTSQPQRRRLSSRSLYHDLHYYWVLNIIFFSLCYTLAFHMQIALSEPFIWKIKVMFSKGI